MTLMVWFVFLSALILFLFTLTHFVFIHKGIEIEDIPSELTPSMVWQMVFYLCTVLVTVDVLFRS